MDLVMKFFNDFSFGNFDQTFLMDVIVSQQNFYIFRSTKFLPIDLIEWWFVNCAIYETKIYKKSGSKLNFRE